MKKSIFVGCASLLFLLTACATKSVELPESTCNTLHDVSSFDITKDASSNDNLPDYLVEDAIDNALDNACFNVDKSVFHNQDNKKLRTVYKIVEEDKSTEGLLKDTQTKTLKITVTSSLQTVKKQNNEMTKSTKYNTQTVIQKIDANQLAGIGQKANLQNSDIMNALQGAIQTSINTILTNEDK
ncbi:hypothetical protein [Helicobacter sp. 11S02629-2]|uniref:hypothetical protein n=1 Tax=Helicobacter sp. 11S02629-2 TaxID=1476195 RepID=UPI000BA70539|nr:hypothetical protein [Helicobacter sp. 11S02629-2]PAF45332.1 hypothetical protein BKH40_03845 [Helicobacter sp. 11S02629-2]